MTRTMVVGARGSKLSLAQVAIVVRALRAAHGDVAIDVREIRTEGDRNTAPLSQIGGLGIFTKALEDALLSREIDIAVHSLKDLPPQLPDGLTLGAVPERADVRDALVTADGRGLGDLAPGARIGTGSARRSVQLKELRPDIDPVEIRGNVPTRITKVESGEYDGAVLAMAGLDRLGLASKAVRVFPVEEMTPAVGQGALGVEARMDDVEALELLRAADHAETRAAVTAERAFLARLGAGCRMPVGAYARVIDGELRIDAMIASGETIARKSSGGAIASAAVLGDALAGEMMARIPA